MRRNIRGFLAYLLVLLLAAGMLAGCGYQAGRADEASAGENPAEDVLDSDNTLLADTSSGDNMSSDASSSESDRSKAEGASAPDSSPSDPAKTPADNIPKIDIEKMDIPQNTALAFVNDMKIGWNLGNTFDAFDCSWLKDEMAYESAWVGTRTTDPMIKLVKEAGFNTIRIPVSWHNHVSGDDYQISEPWLNRVQEVVDYAISRDMYVIINIHHDISKDFIYPTSQYLDQSIRYVKSIWTQLAERFADYDEHLIFESLNEPRMAGHRLEWTIQPDNEECKDAINSINILNQTFVDTVRASGGNIAQRYLMVPGYAASYSGALNSGFILPTDTVPDKLIVSVHAYTPYNFALDAKGVSTFDINKSSSTQEINYFMTELYKKFVSNGIPVVIGEFGARNKKNNLQDRIDFTAYYVASARARGITCIWWDNNDFVGDGELFGLLERSGYRWRHTGIIDAMMEYSQ